MMCSIPSHQLQVKLRLLGDLRSSLQRHQSLNVRSRTRIAERATTLNTCSANSASVFSVVQCSIELDLTTSQRSSPNIKADRASGAKFKTFMREVFPKSRLGIKRTKCAFAIKFAPLP